ncbi:putative ribonuclease H-like domain-containing protein [Tanacetum coccineum]
MRHFARGYKEPRNKEGQFRNQDNTRKHENNEDTSSKAMLAIDGVDFDWSDMVEEQVQTNMVSWAFSDSKILLKIPRKDNMYSFDMKNIVPKESLTCLVAKATLDESMLWHRRLGHINFKNIKFSLLRIIGCWNKMGLQTRKVEKMDYALGIKQGWLHRGHRQEEGIDYEEVFAPVARIEAIRLPKVYKVVKALYGLHQAPRAWYETLANYLLGNGFKRGKIDQTLFIKKQKGDILLIQMSSMGREELTFFQGYKLLAEEDVDLEKLYVKDWSNATDVDVLSL